MKFSSISIAIVSTVVLAQAVSAQDRRGDQVFLNHEEIARVMEKIPPQMELLSGPDNVNWQCTNIDLREHCGDLDGCTANLHMAHKLDPNDMVRGIKEYMYFENALSSQQKGAGLNGYTRQSAGGEHGWITGSSGLYTLFAPWGWAGAYNYRPSFCPGQNGRNSPAHRNPFLITVASHPHVNTVIIIED